MTSKKLDYAKLAVKWICGAGTSKVVHDIIENNTTNESTLDTAKIWIGSGVLGMMIAERVSEFTDSKFDEIAEQAVKFKKNLDAK